MNRISYSGNRLTPFLNQYYATSGNVPSGDILENIVRGEVNAAYQNRNAAEELAMRRKAFDNQLKEAKRARQQGLVSNILGLGTFALAKSPEWAPYLGKVWDKWFPGKQDMGLSKFAVDTNAGWNMNDSGMNIGAPLQTNQPTGDMQGKAIANYYGNRPENLGVVSKVFNTNKPMIAPAPKKDSVKAPIVQEPPKTLAANQTSYSPLTQDEQRKLLDYYKETGGASKDYPSYPLVSGVWNLMKTAGTLGGAGQGRAKNVILDNVVQRMRQYGTPEGLQGQIVNFSKTKNPNDNPYQFLDEARKLISEYDASHPRINL